MEKTAIIWLAKIQTLSNFFQTKDAVTPDSGKCLKILKKNDCIKLLYHKRRNFQYIDAQQWKSLQVCAIIYHDCKLYTAMTRFNSLMNNWFHTHKENIFHEQKKAEIIFSIHWLSFAATPVRACTQSRCGAFRWIYACRICRFICLPLDWTMCR